MTDYLWPVDLVPYQQSFYLQPHTGGSESPFSRQTKVYGLSAPRWVTRMSLRAPDSSDRWAGPYADWGERMDALLAKIEGRANRVLLWDFRRSDQDAALINDAISAGSDTVTFTGGTPQLGKYVSGDGRPHIITRVSGATATVKPPFRYYVAAGAALYGIGYGFFRLTSDDAGSNLSEVGQLTGYDLEFVEDTMPGVLDIISDADYYVDSEEGSDADDGLTIPTAKLTFAGVPWADDINVGFVANSYWREELHREGDTGTIIRKAGPGELPIVDASEPVTAWTINGSYGNVYEKAGWTHTGIEATDRLTIYENGLVLTRVYSVADCSTTPGSFVDVKTSDGATVTLQIHPSDSGNPNTNGKTYDASKRGYGIRLGDDAQLSGVEVMRAITASGPVRVGANSIISRILSRDGTKHNFLLASGLAEDCIAYAAESATSYEPSNIMFVSYLDTTTGYSYLYKRCGAIQLPGLSGTGAWLAHSSNSSMFSTGKLEQCWAVGLVSFDAPGGTLAANCNMTGCYSEALTLGLGYGISDYGLAYAPWQLDGANASVNLLGEYGACTVNHFAAFIEERGLNGNFNEVLRIKGSTTVSNSVFVGSSAVGATNLIANSAGTGTLTWNENVIYSLGAGPIIPTGQSYVGDHNVFFIRNHYIPSQAFFASYHGTDCNTLADWYAATGQDGASVYLDPADQTGPNRFFLGSPENGDFRVNPAAKVYGRDGASHIGTFADGVTITNAGPLAHWDWNARQALAGAPIAFPKVPKTLAQSRNYCLAPEAWAF